MSKRSADHRSSVPQEGGVLAFWLALHGGGGLVSAPLGPGGLVSAPWGEGACTR